MKSKARRPVADSTRELLKARALERGASRSVQVRERVHGAMKTIEDEMASNGGIYPHNKGAVSSAEVARRANVHETTFFSAKLRDLGDEVRAWRKNLKKLSVIGRGPVRRELSSRLEDWQRQYEGLTQSHRDTELELQETQRSLEIARAQIRELETETTRLQMLLQASTAGKVVPLPPRQ